MLAACLGWLVLDERLAGTTLAGAALVVLGVAGAFYGERRAANPASPIA
jgi:drug/metabolite transporter (DMT)-like permease